MKPPLKITDNILFLDLVLPSVSAAEPFFVAVPATCGCGTFHEKMLDLSSAVWYHIIGRMNKLIPK